MKKINIPEMNHRIALFMGAEKTSGFVGHPDDSCNYYYKLEMNLESFEYLEKISAYKHFSQDIRSLKFHTYIEWQMPVLTKIAMMKSLKKNGMYFSVDIHSFQHSKDNYDHKTHDYDSGLPIPQIYTFGYSVCIGIVKAHSINGGLIAVGRDKILEKAIFKAICEFMDWFEKSKLPSQ